MCVSHGVRVVTVTTRSCDHYIGALLTSVPASVFLFLSLFTKLCRFSPLRLCTSAPLRLCTSAPLRLCSALLSVLLWSQHCTALVAHLLSSLFCSSLCCGIHALCSLHSTLLCIPLYSFRLCICVCFRLNLTRRVALYICKELSKESIRLNKYQLKK